MRYKLLPGLSFKQHFSKPCGRRQTPPSRVQHCAPGVPGPMELTHSTLRAAQPPPLNRTQHTALVFAAAPGEPQASSAGACGVREKTVHCGMPLGRFPGAAPLLVLTGRLNQSSLGEHNSSTGCKQWEGRAVCVKVARPLAPPGPLFLCVQSPQCPLVSLTSAPWGHPKWDPFTGR